MPVSARHRVLRRQRGSMAIAMMLMLLGLITILGIVEVGYLYWAKRDAQKAADLAALSGAQQLTGPACPAGSSAYAAASGNASDNGATAANGYSSIDISCGRQPASGSSILAPASASSVAAIKVSVERDVNHLLGFAWKSTYPVHAQAVAINGTPIAAFSVGSRTAGIDPDSPLNQLLDQTLGTSLGLQLLSYNGIANTDISLLDLVENLPIDAGTVDGVLKAPITVGDFLDAYVQALTKSTDAADIDLGLVQQEIAQIEAQIGDVSITLGDILNVNADTTDPNAALNVNVNALDILDAVILAGDSENAIALPATTVDIPGVATLKLMASIVEPPQIGIGGVGTTAHTAQIRLGVDVTALNTPITGQSLLDLPLYLEVAPADATLTSLQCNVPNSQGKNSDNVVITGAPGVLNAYLGKLTADAFDNTSLSWSSLIAGGSPAPLVNVSVLGTGLVTISASANVQVAANPAQALSFSVDPTIPVSEQSGMTQTAGASSSSVLSTLIGSLLGSTTLQVNATVLGLSITLPASVLSPILSTLSDALSPVLSSVDQLLTGPLLQLLGIQIGTADVNLLDVNCNAGPQLVY